MSPESEKQQLSSGRVAARKVTTDKVPATVAAGESSYTIVGNYVTVSEEADMLTRLCSYWPSPSCSDH